jgi:hypothetical protein
VPCDVAVLVQVFEEHILQRFLYQEILNVESLYIETQYMIRRIVPSRPDGESSDAAATPRDACRQLDRTRTLS